MRNDNRALTFIELIIVTSLVAVIALAFYGMLGRGIQVWHLLKERVPAEDVSIFFDRFTTDVANSARCSGIGFLGSKSRVELVTSVISRAMGIRTAGKAVYWYDEASSTLSRGTLDYSQVYQEQEPQAAQTIAGVKGCAFQYCYYDPDKKAYSWKEDAGEGPGLPLAITIEVDLEDGTHLVRMVRVPIGG